MTTVAHKETPMELTRSSLLKVTEANDGFHLVCRWCYESLLIPIPFYPVSAINDATGKRYTIKTKETFMKNFLELHYGKHMRQLTPQWDSKGKKKKA